MKIKRGTRHCKLITHRIVNITNEGYITKGDANEDPNQWTVKKENIIGKAILTIHTSDT